MAYEIHITSTLGNFDFYNRNEFFRWAAMPENQKFKQNYHSFNDQPATYYCITDNQSNKHVTKKWYKNGLIHRANGPAEIVYINDIVAETRWALYGMEYLTYKDFIKNNNELSNEEKTLLILQYG